MDYDIIIIVAVALALWVLINRYMKTQHLERINADLDSLEKNVKEINVKENSLEREIEKNENLSRSLTSKMLSKPANKAGITEQEQVSAKFSLLTAEEIKEDEDLINVIKEEEKAEIETKTLILEEKKEVAEEIRKKKSKSEQNKKCNQAAIIEAKAESTKLHVQAELIARTEELEKAREIELLAKEKELEARHNQDILKLEEAHSVEIDRLQASEEAKNYFQAIEKLSDQIKELLSKMEKSEESILQLEEKLKVANENYHVFLKFCFVNDEIEREEREAEEHTPRLQAYIDAYNSTNIQKLKQLLASEYKNTNLSDNQILNNCRIIIDSGLDDERKGLEIMKSDDGEISWGRYKSRTLRRREKKEAAGINNGESDTRRWGHNMKLLLEMEGQLSNLKSTNKNYLDEKNNLEKQRDDLQQKNRQLIENYNSSVLNLTKMYKDKKDTLDENYAKELIKLKSNPQSSLKEAA